MKNSYLLFLALIFSVTVVGQSNEDNYRRSFVEGSQLMEEFNYAVAVDIWVDLIKDQPDNANLNFKAGLCLLKLPKRRKEALPYLEKAVANISRNYDPYNPNEKGAPVSSYYLIGEAYHLNYEMDKAIEYYNEFKTLISEKHEFWAKVDNQIQMCENAKEAVANPIDIQIVNLGGLVNGIYPDYAPVVSVDESAMYFTSKRLRKDSSNLYAKNLYDGEFFEDIYVSYKGDDGAWGEPEQLNVNTSDNEATLNISADGETIFIYKSSKDSENGDLFEIKLDGTKWTEPVPLGSDINTEYHESHVAIAPDGNKLYFVSNRKGSMTFPDKAHEKVESNDIYFCNKLPTGEWALAQPLGPTINTPYHEDGVFIHPDGKTMYFSSEGHKSIGGYDVFYSELDDEGNWGPPVNLGYPINTTDNDVFFVTSADGKRGYYSSIRDEGFGDKDIYVISLLGFKEKPLTLLIGEITSEDSIPGNIVIDVTDNNSGETVGTYRPRARDNKFTVIIPPGSDYHLTYMQDDNVFFEDDIFVPENSAYQEIKKAVSLGAVDIAGIKKDATPEAPETPEQPKEKEPEAPKVQETPKEPEAPKVVVPVVTEVDIPKEQPKEPVVTEAPKEAPKQVQPYQTQVQEIDGKKYMIHNVQKGQSLFAISLMYNTKFDVVQAENPWASDKIYEGDQVRIPIPPHAKFYQEFFDYNVTDIGKDAEDFANFTNQVKLMVEANGKARVMIESSASKVPTAKHGSNESLTKKRAEDAKAMLIESMKTKGVTESQLEFISMSTLVRGPEYQNDAAENRATYKNFQYVKLIVK